MTDNEPRGWKLKLINHVQWEVFDVDGDRMGRITRTEKGDPFPFGVFLALEDQTSSSVPVAYVHSLVEGLTELAHLRLGIMTGAITIEVSET